MYRTTNQPSISTQISQTSYNPTTLNYEIKLYKNKNKKQFKKQERAIQ